MVKKCTKDTYRFEIVTKNAHNHQHIFIINPKTKITNLKKNPVIL